MGGAQVTCYAVPEEELVAARARVVARDPLWASHARTAVEAAREKAGILSEAQFVASVEAYLLGEPR